MINRKHRVFLILGVVSGVQLLGACKNSSATKAKLRGAETVTLNATFRVINSSLKIGIVPGPATITDVKTNVVPVQGMQVDLKKMSGNNEILLTNVAQANITATITTGNLKDATCVARGVPLKPTVVTASFSCTADSTPDDNGSSTIKKYPPEVTDSETRKIFDQLAVDCKKSAGNRLVIDGEIVYGCYCSKIDHQLLFINFKDGEIGSFLSECSGQLTTAQRMPLTMQLANACDTANNGPSAPNPNYPNPAPPKQTASCQCPSRADANQITIAYAEFYNLYKPVDAFLKKRTAECVTK